jgi:hypothetical protein
MDLRQLLTKTQKTTSCGGFGEFDKGTTQSVRAWKHGIVRVVKVVRIGDHLRPTFGEEYEVRIM